MARYAILNDRRQCIEIREFEVLPAHKPGRVLPLVTDEMPTVGPTEKAVPGPVEVRETDAIERWVVVQKTAEEMRKTWSSMEFLLRFTKFERKAIRNLAKTDADVADFLLLVQSAQQVESDHPLTTQGLAYLEALGAITAQRKAEILG